MRPVFLAGARLFDWLPPVVIVGLGLLGLQPFGLGSDYLSAVIVTAGLYMLLAMGLNVVVGYSGLLDLGYAGFWAVGAYTTAIVTGKAPFHPLALGVWAAIPFAIFAAVVSGLLLGLVTLRVRGDYLAIVTLGFGEIVRITANSWDSVTNGPSGITDIPHPELFGLSFGLDPRRYVALIWVLIAILYLLIGNLWRSRIGRAWYATRQDEGAAETLGVPTFRMKLLAFATGASTAGFAGAVYASYVGYIMPGNFVLQTAIMILAAVVLGGMSNMQGAMVGAAAIVFLPELFRDFEQWRFLAFGAILIGTMIVRPSGLFPLRPRRYVLPESVDSDGLPAESRLSAACLSDAPPILRCVGLSKQFGGLAAVRDIGFDVPEGTIFAVIGPNGAGKSTLFNLISGGLSADAGRVEFGGRPIAGRKPHEIAELGMARTFQLIRLLPSVTVAENVLVGADVRSGANVPAIVLSLPNARRADRKGLAETDAALSFCGIRHLAGAIAGELSYGDQRRVEIARALATSPRLLLLDEPAAGMNPTERRELGELIQRICARGITVVIVEHDLDLIMRISHRVVVLDSGQVIARGAPQEVQRDPRVVEAYLGRRRQDAQDRPVIAEAGSTPSAGATAALLSVRGLRVAYGAVEVVHDVDLDVARGEIVALIGANGAGKSSTLLALSGVQRPKGGRVSYEEKQIERWPAHRIAASGMAHVPEGRRIFPRMTVWENLLMGTYTSHTIPNDRDLESIFRLFPILKTRLHQVGGTLSGGEQQMLAMARALVSRPKLLLLDEPSMGLAPQMVDLVFGLIAEINRAGVSILLVEQNAEMALGVANRAYVLESGRVRLAGLSSTLRTDPRIQAAYLGA
jgi:branched-chain amino acid transport system ATP-binding protein